MREGSKLGAKYAPRSKTGEANSIPLFARIRVSLDARPKVWYNTCMSVMQPTELPGVSSEEPQEVPNLSSSCFTPLPSSFKAPLGHPNAHSSPLTPVICDDRAVARLLEQLLEKAGITIKEAAEKLGMESTNSVRQYITGRRVRPSLMWFVRFAEMCGARVIIEWPGR